MKFVSLVCCVASVAATVDWNTIFPRGNTSLLNAREARIINGQIARSKQFPYQAGLLIQQGDDFAWCGGTLLSNNWVLTAAHCTQSYKITRIHVILGAFDLSVVSELGRQIITVDRTNIIVHEEYDSYQNDISLIRLPYPSVELDDYIQPAKLPTNRYSTYSGVYAIASGWGRTSNSAPAPTNKLLWISVPILDNSICSGAYPSGTGTGSLIQTSHICISTVGIKAVCNGDSGGPLVLAGSNTVIGITSFGPTSGCENGWPNVFTRVSYYLDWISDNTGLNVTKSNNAVSSTLLRNGSQITTSLIVIIFLYKHLILLQLYS